MKTDEERVNNLPKFKQRVCARAGMGTKKIWGHTLLSSIILSSIHKHPLPLSKWVLIWKRKTKLKKKKLIKIDYCITCGSSSFVKEFKDYFLGFNSSELIILLLNMILILKRNITLKSKHLETEIDKIPSNPLSYTFFK